MIIYGWGYILPPKVGSSIEIRAEFDASPLLIKSENES